MSLIVDILTDDLYEEIDRLKKEVFACHNRSRFCECKDCVAAARKMGMVKFTRTGGKETWVDKKDHAELSKSVKCDLCNERFQNGDLMFMEDGDFGNGLWLCDDCYWDNQY